MLTAACPHAACLKKHWQCHHHDSLLDSLRHVPQVDYKRLMAERAQVVMDAEALMKLRDQLADMTLCFDKVGKPWVATCKTALVLVDGRMSLFLCTLPIITCCC
jgi:hypothetical protein